ncbi:MAG: thiamine diphosphokinase [Butyrivibrio sp.]|nr:thiamine diphosphokinase [Butyrivibrio sp.]
MNEPGKCLIISGGAFADLSRQELYADYVIACDSGLDYADRYGIVPDLVMGDYDSVSEENLKRIETNEIKSLRFPKEKDDTDTSLALKHALELGYKDIRMVCVFGNRMDHAFANIQVAHYGAKRGATVRMYDEKTKITVFSNSKIELAGKKGCNLSVFSLSDASRNVTIKGTKYELESGELTNSFPLGQSNEITCDKAEVSVEDGVIMVILS